MRREDRAVVMLRLWWLWLPIGLVVVVFGVTDRVGVLDPMNPFSLGLLLLVWSVTGAGVAFRRRR